MKDLPCLALQEHTEVDADGAHASFVTSSATRACCEGCCPAAHAPLQASPVQLLSEFPGRADS